MAGPLCQIVLDNQWNTFYGGSVITGHVKINLLKEKKVRAILIKFLGEAKTRWSESVSYTDANGKRQTRIVWYSGHEIYLKHKQYLLGGSSGSSITLLPGEYVYPISCVIPPTVPCSFEGTFGHVRYTAKAILDRPWKFDQGSKMAFTVISPMDLNQNQLLRQPVNLTLDKTFCCFFCRSGPLTATVHLPSTGFVPGQIVPIVVDIDNASNVDVERLCISLRQYTTFKTTLPRQGIRKVSNTISKVSLGPVAKRNSHNQVVNVTVPSIPPSNLLFCNLIDLDYSFKVECCVSGMHVNLEGKMPVVIGTVPLMMANIPPMPSVTSVQPSAPFPEPAANPQMPWYQDPTLPPPSYEESTYRADIADQSDSEHIHLTNGQFAPRYPVFPMTQQQQQPQPMSSKLI